MGKEEESCRVFSAEDMVTTLDNFGKKGLVTTHPNDLYCIVKG
jgi:hypothetical protein